MKIMVEVVFWLTSAVILGYLLGDFVERILK